MASARNRRYTKEEWNEHRYFIENMYPLKGITLPDIAEFLKRETGFHATERQYKRKIHDWGLEKKVKTHEMQRIAHAQHHHAASGKTVVAYVRNQRVSNGNIRRFIRRKKFDPRSLSAGGEILGGHNTTQTGFLASVEGLIIKTSPIYGNFPQGLNSSMKNLTLHDYQELEYLANHSQCSQDGNTATQVSYGNNTGYTSSWSSDGYERDPAYTSDRVGKLFRFQSFESQKMHLRSGLAEFSWDLVIDFGAMWDRLGVSHLESSQTPLRDVLNFGEPDVTYHSSKEVWLKKELLHLGCKPRSNWQKMSGILHTLHITSCIRGRYNFAAQYNYLLFKYSRTFGGDSYSNTLSDLFNFQFLLSDWKADQISAEKFSMIVRERARKVMSHSSNDMLSIDINTVDCLKANRNYQKALGIISETLRISRMTLDLNSNLSLWITRKLAELLLRSGQLREGERLLRELISLSSSKGKPSEFDAEHSLQLAIYLNSQQRWREA
ncbi:hypothetical protein PVAG01_02785 [Phlyctema vagabunda]|uniref:Clr5 domain-containing protein n=1 Tax=Phlyctema vagabunda TaxID=108571 RepID=A0ABR4PRV0_9HELO